MYQKIEQNEGEITKNEVKDALGNMICNKKPENDGLTSGFYEALLSFLSHKKSFCLEN